MQNCSIVCEIERTKRNKTTTTRNSAKSELKEEAEDKNNEHHNTQSAVRVVVGLWLAVVRVRLTRTRVGRVGVVAPGTRSV